MCTVYYTNYIDFDGDSKNVVIYSVSFKIENNGDFPYKCL